MQGGINALLFQMGLNRRFVVFLIQGRNKLMKTGFFNATIIETLGFVGCNIPLKGLTEMFVLVSTCQSKCALPNNSGHSYCHF